jgi:WD40 repeat protein
MPITDLQWSSDRTYFITASKDKSAKVRDTVTRTTNGKLTYDTVDFGT